MDQADAPTAPGNGPSVTNRSLLLPYAAPYFAFVAIGGFSDGRLSPEISYILRLLTVPPLLWWGARWYVSLLGPKNPWGSSIWGVFAGTVGIALWEPWGRCKVNKLLTLHSSFFLTACHTAGCVRPVRRARPAIVSRVSWYARR